MDLKSLFVGVIIGGVTMAAAIKMLEYNDMSVESSVEGRVTSGHDRRNSELPNNGVSETSSRESVPARNAVEDVIPADAAEDLRMLPADALNQTTDFAPNRQDPAPTGQSHRQLLDQYQDADPRESAPSNSRRELENDPKDYEWSYFMEQAIGLFLASHSEIGYFDITGIECRTRICEIQSFGADESAVPRWGLVVHDLKNQPWNDFVRTGSSSSTIDGRLVILTHLRRPEE